MSKPGSVKTVHLEIQPRGSPNPNPGFEATKPRSFGVEKMCSCELRKQLFRYFKLRYN